MSGSFLSILLILSLPFEGLALYFLIRKIFDVLEYCEDLREAEDAKEDCDAAGISGKRTENERADLPVRFAKQPEGHPKRGQIYQRKRCGPHGTVRG